MYRWGCIHEHDALKTYKDKMFAHINVTVTGTVLFISQERPYIGASPDAMITCDCCGQETVEVKCPYCFKDKLPEENAKNFCMAKDEEGTY